MIYAIPQTDLVRRRAYACKYKISPFFSLDSKKYVFLAVCSLTNRLQIDKVTYKNESDIYYSIILLNQLKSLKRL